MKENIQQHFIEVATLDQYTKEIKKNESLIESGFVYLGRLFGELLQNRLYKVKYNTFKQYVEDNFTFTVRNAYRFIQIHDMLRDCDIDVTKIGVAKLIQLIRIPDSNKEDYVESNKEFLEEATVNEVKEQIDKELSQNAYTPYFKSFKRFYKTQ